MQFENILNVKVPDALRDTVKTGIEWFDAAISSSGGFVPSIAYMLDGIPGAGKSTLLRQLGDALTRSGHVVLYNSGEESKEQIAFSIERLKFTHGFIVTSFVQVDDVIAAANQLAAQHPGKKVVVFQDSLQKLRDKQRLSGRTPGRVCHALTQWAKQTMNVVVFVCQVTKKGDFKGNNEILHDLDARISLRVDKQDNRILVIPKNRFGLVNMAGIGYSITDEGLKASDIVAEVADELDNGDEKTNDEKPKKRRRRRRKANHLKLVKNEAAEA